MAAATTSTRSSRKKTTKRAKSISVDKAEVEKQEAIKKALEDQKKKHEEDLLKIQANMPDDAEFEDEYEDEEEPQGFGVTHDPYYEEPLEEEFDIMQFGADLEASGKDVSYYIKKDGAFLTELFASIPIHELKKKFGGGKYTVYIKNARGKFIKQNTFRVQGDPTPEKVETPTIPNPQLPNLDFNQTFKGMTDVFMQMQEMVARERGRNERDEKKGSETFNTTIFSVLNEQSKSTQTMIMEMQKSNMEMLKTISESTTRALEKAEDRNREMIKELKGSLGKKEEFGLKEMLALIESSRNNGMDTMKTILELSETFAEMRGGNDEPQSKDSMLGSLISNFIPILQQAKAQQAQAMPGVAPQLPGTLNPQTQRRMVQQAGPVHRAPQAPVPHQPQRQIATRPNPVRGETPPPSPLKGPGQVVSVKKENISANSLGFPSIADKQRKMPPTASLNEVSQKGAGLLKESSEEFIAKTMKELNESNPAPNLKEGSLTPEQKQIAEQIKAVMPMIRVHDIYKKATSSQQLIVELALPTIAMFMNDPNYSPDTPANLVIADCVSQGITPQILAKEFTFDFMFQIASSFGVGEDKKIWFGEFYEVIKDAAGINSDGEEESSLG